MVAFLGLMRKGFQIREEHSEEIPGLKHIISRHTGNPFLHIHVFKDLDFGISAHMLIVFVCTIAVKNKDSAFCYNIRLEINMINICSILVLPGDEQIIYTFTTSTTMIL